jgi:ketosteroid isomerase-like protein
VPPQPSELRAIAETAFRSLNSGDLDGFLAVVADDAEFKSMILELEDVTFRGPDGVRTWWNVVRTSFEGVQWEMVELMEWDQRAVARVRAAANLGGAWVEQLVWQAATIRDGKLTWWASFRSEEEALAALAHR